MNRAIKGLGEIALRVADLDTMQRFYQDEIGLEFLRRFEHAVFFRIAEGHGGHAQVLALFDRGNAGLCGRELGHVDQWTISPSRSIWQISAILRLKLQKSGLIYIIRAGLFALFSSSAHCDLRPISYNRHKD